MLSGSHGFQVQLADSIQRARSEETERRYRPRGTDWPARRPVPRRPHVLGVALVLLGALLVSTAIGPQFVDASATDPATVATRFFDELHTEGNLHVADELVAPGAFVHTPDGVMRGPAGVAGLVTSLRTAFPDATFPISEVAVAGDTVLVRWTMHGTHDGEYAGVAPTGTSVTMEGIAILRVRNGQIVEDWVQYDRLGLLQQLGALPGPAPESSTSTAHCPDCLVTP